MALMLIHFTRRPRRHASQRGMALILVVLVVSILSSLGMYAITTVAKVDAAAGHNRQALQTHYIAELGARSAIAYFSTVQPSTVFQTATTNTTAECAANMGSAAARSCVAVNSDIIFKSTTAAIRSPVTGTGSLIHPLGGTLEGLVRVEATEVFQAGEIPGMAVKGTANAMTTAIATITATGVVSPAAPAAAANNCPHAAVASRQSLRVHITMWPIPGQK